MALIGTLRNKMTKWVVGFVAVAIVSFILNDLFGNGPRSIIGNTDNVGEIGGTTISLKEYQNAVQERENNYIMNFGRQPGERERPTLQQQAWELLIVKHAIKAQFEKVGVVVTPDEVWDMIQGKNVDENVRQSFLDSAGNFDRRRVVEYINSFDSPQPTDPRMLAAWQDARYRWSTFQKDLGLGRERIKYENLIMKTNYVTSAEAERDYHNQNDVAEARYLYVPFFAISDSVVSPSDSDLKAYYEKNKKKYKVQETRTISFVRFPVQASSEDSTQLREEANRLAADFKTVADDSVFAMTNTDAQNAFEKYTVATLPTFLSEQPENLKAGVVIGPFLDGGSYKIAKVVSVGSDTTATAKASHILIKWDSESDADKKAAKEKARKILNEIKAGADFAAKAREHGTDGTASRGGDLGWFSSGQMVKPFESAVFNAKKAGLLNDVVETQFGYHIISVTNVKDNTAYTVATIELTITPSEDTQNAAFLRAQNFVSDLSGVDAFKARANQEGLLMETANDLGASDRRVGNLGDARQIVTWLFRDGKVGKVSDIFDLDDEYIAVIMTEVVEEGYKPFEKTKAELVNAVKNELKGKKIVEKLASQKGTLEEMSAAFGNDATVYSSSDIKLNSNTLTGVGLDPIAVGKVFAQTADKVSAPIIGENGVIVIQLQNKTIAPEVGDYSMFKNQLLQGLNGRFGFAIAEAIKEVSNIEDKRYRFF